MRWKIADFGLTSEGTDTDPCTTQDCRGTSSYRAPELIQEIKRTYTQKVDIWALGCIFYKLAYLQKAFPTDFTLFAHTASQQEIPIPTRDEG
jgi:serine/threonine protein kinase